MPILIVCYRLVVTFTVCARLVWMCIRFVFVFSFSFYLIFFHVADLFGHNKYGLKENAARIVQKLGTGNKKKKKKVLNRNEEQTGVTGWGKRVEARIR